MNTQSRYIVFDGMDGSGKGTQIDLLKKVFDAHHVIFTREPGGPPLAEEIRKIILDSPFAVDSTDLFQFFGFWMAREESLHKLVMPALQSGKHVFSDRGDSSTFAFQLPIGEQRQEMLDAFALMRKLVFAKERGRRPPDQYIIFDLPAETARERALQDATRAKNHLDGRDLAHYERVRDGFRQFERRAPVEFIDATQTPEKIHREVLEVLDTLDVVP